MPETPTLEIAPNNRHAGRRRPRDQRVKRFRRQMIIVAPHLDDPKYAPLIASFARISILALDSYEFLRERGLTNESGELRSSVEVVSRLFSNQLKLATALGLSPATVGRFRNEKPADLVGALAEHDEARNADD
jgi:hypothetical protein